MPYRCVYCGEFAVQVGRPFEYCMAVDCIKSGQQDRAIQFEHTFEPSKPFRSPVEFFVDLELELSERYVRRLRVPKWWFKHYIEGDREYIARICERMVNDECMFPYQWEKRFNIPPGDAEMLEDWAFRLADALEV